MALPQSQTLWRFPGPIALAAALDGAPASLHHADATRVFLGDLTLWGWPGVAEFGALTVFGADRLTPTPGDYPGWYIVAPCEIEPDRVLYVPDADCAQAVAPAADAAAARALLPAHYDAAVSERRRNMAEYAALLDRWIAAREALPDPAAFPGADEPLYLRPAAERAALIARMLGPNDGGRSDV